MSAPTELPIWADAPTDPVPGLPGTIHPIVEPSDAVKHQGWVGERPPLNVFNWWMNLVYQWVAWFDTTISATQLMAVPIGAILDWHGSFANCPALPNGFVECNGQTLSDAASPFNGQVIPDLNGQGYFTRGSATSGIIQASQNLSHNHSQNAHQHGASGLSGALTNTYPGGGNTNIIGVGNYNGPVTFANGTDKKYYEEAPLVTINGNTANETATNNATAAGTPDESRPVNISMIKIMRVH